MQDEMIEFCPRMNAISEVGKEEKAEDIESVREENVELPLHVGN